jgi:hypothetical protein
MGQFVAPSFLRHMMRVLFLTFVTRRERRQLLDHVGQLNVLGCQARNLNLLSMTRPSRHASPLGISCHWTVVAFRQTQRT